MFRYYFLNTLSGHERKIRSNLIQHVAKAGLSHLVREISIPEETYLKTHEDGSKEELTRRLLPGYLLIEADLIDELWNCINTTPGIRYVGAGGKPTHLSAKEIAWIKHDTEKQPKKETKHSLSINDDVQITSGPFSGMQGRIIAIESHDKVQVGLEFLDREVPVELETSAIRKI